MSGRLAVRSVSRFTSFSFVNSYWVLNRVKNRAESFAATTRDICKISHAKFLTLECPSFSNIASPNIAFVCSPRCRGCFRSAARFPTFCARVPLLCLSDTFIHRHIRDMFVMMHEYFITFVNFPAFYCRISRIYLRSLFRFFFLYFKKHKCNQYTILRIM